MKIKKITVERTLEDVFGSDCRKQFMDRDSRLSKDFPMYFDIVSCESEDYFKDARFMKYAYDDEILGVCTFSFDPAEGNDYYVLNDLEKSKSCTETGIGTALIQAVIDQAEKEGKDYIYLLAPDFNVEYYEKFGFVKGRYERSSDVNDETAYEFPQLKKTPHRKSYDNYWMTLELKDLK